MSVTEARPALLRETRIDSGKASALALAGMETRAGLRSAAFRLVLILSLILGWTVGGQPGRGVSLSAWATGEAAWRYLGFLVIIWMSLAAVHDTVSRTDIIVYSKPQPTERLVLARFLAVFVQLICATAAMYVAAILSRLYFGGGLHGIGAYESRFVVSVGVIFFTGASSYSLALLARTPLAGIVVGLYWLMTLAGKEYLAKAYFPAYTQNQATFVFIGLALICAACAFHRRQRRGSTPAAGSARIGIPAFLALSGLMLYGVIANGHDPQVRTHPILDRMGEQNATFGYRAPGFRLPDESGKLVSPADTPDGIMVIALFSVNDPESAFVLARLEDVKQKYGAKGVQPIAVCLSEDIGAATAFAKGEGVTYPVVQDWGTHNSDKPSDMSPIATAYQVTILPHLVVTDRRRNVRAIINGVDCYEGPLLDSTIEARLKEEPE